MLGSVIITDGQFFGPAICDTNSSQKQKDEDSTRTERIYKAYHGLPSLYIFPIFCLIAFSSPQSRDFEKTWTPGATESYHHRERTEYVYTREASILHYFGSTLLIPRLRQSVNPC